MRNCVERVSRLICRYKSAPQVSYSSVSLVYTIILLPASVVTTAKVLSNYLVFNMNYIVRLWSLISLALFLGNCASSSVGIVHRQASVALESHNQVRTLKAAQNPSSIVRRSFDDNLLCKDVELHYMDGEYLSVLA